MYKKRYSTISNQALLLLIISISFGSAYGSTTKELMRGISTSLPATDNSIQIGNDPAEYDEETGIPLCVDCHSREKKPAINYTNDPECLQCHESDYSERFLAIDKRYKVSVKEVTESYRHYARMDHPETATQQSTGKTIKPPEGMILIPAGTFIMGSDEWWPKSGPQHKRELPDFFIDKYEVTNRDYNDFVNAKKHRSPLHWEAGRIPRRKDDHPVTFVDWFDANAYCKWQGKRIPTEAEWEKAARGTDGRAFPWGDEFDKNKANTPQYGHKGTMPVGVFEEGVSPYGVHDMAGNVFEWTQDWYKAYPGNQHPDPNEGERYRVVRGGSWFDCTFYKCGISAPTFNRIFFNPYSRNNNFGFRCAKDLE